MTQKAENIIKQIKELVEVSLEDTTTDDFEKKYNTYSEIVKLLKTNKEYISSEECLLFIIDICKKHHYCSNFMLLLMTEYILTNNVINKILLLEECKNLTYDIIVRQNVSYDLTIKLLDNSLKLDGWRKLNDITLYNLYYLGKITLSTLQRYKAILLNQKRKNADDKRITKETIINYKKIYGKNYNHSYLIYSIMKKYL